MTKEYSWMLGPFEKAAEANPCLVPNAVSRFFCPVQEKELGWEAKDVFNPAAVVKDDRVYLLYRSLSFIPKRTNFLSMNGRAAARIPVL